VALPKLGAQHLVYLERVKTTRVFVRDVTPVPPHALLLFARGAVEASPSSGGAGANSSFSSFGKFGLQNYNEDVVVRLDGWLGIRVPRRDLDVRMLSVHTVKDPCSTETLSVHSSVVPALFII